MSGVYVAGTGLITGYLDTEQITKNKKDIITTNESINNLTTDDIVEGETNLYYTDERVDNNISLKTTDDIAEGATNLYYTEERVDNNISLKTTDDIAEGEINLYYTDERVDTNISLKTSDDIVEGSTNLYYTDDRVNTNISLKTSDNIAEGETNLYYTDARVDNKLNQFSLDKIKYEFYDQTINQNYTNKVEVFPAGISMIFELPELTKYLNFEANQNTITIHSEQITLGSTLPDSQISIALQISNGVVDIENVLAYIDYNGNGLPPTIIDESGNEIVNPDYIPILPSENRQVIDFKLAMMVVNMLIKEIEEVGEKSIGETIWEYTSGVLTVGSLLWDVYQAAQIKGLIFGNAVSSSIDIGKDLAESFSDEVLDGKQLKDMTNEHVLSRIVNHLDTRSQSLTVKDVGSPSVPDFRIGIGDRLGDYANVNNSFKTINFVKTGFKENIYVPDIYIGAFVADTNGFNLFPSSKSLNSELIRIDNNIDTIENNINSINTTIQFIPVQYQINITEITYDGTIWASGNDRNGEINSYNLTFNNNDTLTIVIDEPARFATDPNSGNPNISVYLNVNGVEQWLLGMGDSQSRTVILKYGDSVSIYSRFTDPNYGNPDVMNFSTFNFVINNILSDFYTKEEIQTSYQLKADAFSGNYDDLNNLPTLFSGNYDDLNNLPTLFSGNYDDLNNLPTLFSGNYDDLNNKPNLSVYTLNTELNTEITNTSNYVESTSNIISNRITNLSYTELNDLPAIWNYALKSELNTEITHTSNYVKSTSNIISNRITDLAVGSINGLQEALNGKAGLDHNHTIANVFGLQSALDGKALSTHNHSISEIIDLQAKLNEKAFITDLNGKADALHNHYAEDILDLQGKLDLYKLNSDFNQDVSDIIQTDIPSYAGDYLSYIQSTNKLQVDLTLLLQNSDYTLIPGLQSAIDNAGSGSSGTSVWTQNDTKIYYNLGNVGIGNLNPYYKTHIKADLTDNTLKGSSLAVEGNTDSYLWALSRNTTGTATLGLMTDYQAFDETTETGNATGLTITYFNQPTFKGASFQIGGSEFIQMNQDTNRIDINGKNLYLDSYEILPYQTTREQILLYMGTKEHNINYTTRGGTVSLYNANDTGGGTFTIDENNDLNLTLEYLDTGFSIKKLNGQTLQNIFYIDENVCYINDTILSRTATEPPLNFNVGIFADTIRGTINRRADITTDIVGTETYYADGYPIFENAIQVKEIIFTDDPTFRFKSKTELRDAILTLDPNLTLTYDANNNLKVTDSVAYSDTKVINLLQSAFGDYLNFDPESVFGSVNILQVSQAIDYNNIPNLTDAIANSGGGSSVPTGTTNNILFYDAHLGEFKNDNNFINVTMTFVKERYDPFNGAVTESYDMLTIGEDPLNPNAGLIDLKNGSVKAFYMNIDDRLEFNKTIEFNGTTYILGGGYIENVWTGENLVTNFAGDSAVFDNALIKKLTVNDFDVKGTIGQLDSAIPTKLAQSSQTTLRRTYGTSLDTEEAVYSTYYNKYTNDIEVYGIIFQDNTYISSTQDIKDAISITDYALQTSLDTTNTNVSTNTSDIAALDLRLTTEENKDHFVNGNEILTLGNGTANTTPSLRLLGNNSQSVSSRIVFGDAAYNNPSYYQGMAIYYDSSYNSLHISGDNDYNQIVDAPPAISVMRQTRYVGIQNTNPQYVLDIAGDVNTTGKYYSNGISLNNLVNDNSIDIINHNTRITTLENFNGVEKNNEKINLGNYTTSYTPELLLAGGNGTTLSSRISFLDGVAPNTYAMSIVYDSYNNILNIAGDDDGNNIVDTPNKLSVRRNGNVGVGKDIPTYKLDVNGDVNCTGNFKVNGTNFDAEYIKGLLETAGYRVLKNVMLNMTFTYQYITNTLVNTWFKINPMGGADTVRINNGSFTLDYTNYRINIPQTGTYRINYNMNFTDVSSDRINMTISLYLNGAYLPASESRGSYGRFNGWQFGNACGFIANLTAGDYLEFYGYMNRYGASYYFQVNGGASQLSIELIS